MLKSSPVVLVVEDEPLIRMNLVDLLLDSGFEPLTAAHADEAIKILGYRPDIEIVLTDIQMPGPIDGIKLAKTIGRRWPKVKLVLTSGLVGRIPECDLPPRTVFVPKPIKVSTLLAALFSLSGRDANGVLPLRPTHLPQICNVG